MWLITNISQKRPAVWLMLSLMAFVVCTQGMAASVTAPVKKAYAEASLADEYFMVLFGVVVAGKEGEMRRMEIGKWIINSLSILVLVLLLAGCNRRELEVMEPQKTQLRLDVDWVSKFGYKPNGMTVMIWGDGWTAPSVSSTNNVESMKIELDPGNYRMIVMSKSFDEYGSMRFRDTASFENISAHGADITQYYNGPWDATDSSNSVNLPINVTTTPTP